MQLNFILKNFLPFLLAIIIFATTSISTEEKTTEHLSQSKHLKKFEHPAIVAAPATSNPLNQYGDRYTPTEDGRGVDIASQRLDDLDLSCLKHIYQRASTGCKIRAVDLGGGFGAQSIQMALAGASVKMIDVNNMAAENFNAVIESGCIQPENLVFIQKDFNALSEKDIPEKFDVLYSQRSLHYVTYIEAKQLLQLMFNNLTAEGAIFLSAAGWDTEYGKSYPDRDKPIRDRYNFIAADMQKKHGITHKIVTYTENELFLLLKEIGFTDITVTSSAFGNIKATARRS